MPYKSVGRASSKGLFIDHIVPADLRRGCILKTYPATKCYCVLPLHFQPTDLEMTDCVQTSVTSDASCVTLIWVKHTESEILRQVSIHPTPHLLIIK